MSDSLVVHQGARRNTIQYGGDVGLARGFHRAPPSLRGRGEWVVGTARKEIAHPRLTASIGRVCGPSRFFVRFVLDEFFLSGPLRPPRFMRLNCDGID
jgi:hypothetical protein